MNFQINKIYFVTTLRIAKIVVKLSLQLYYIFVYLYNYYLFYYLMGKEQHQGKIFEEFSFNKKSIRYIGHSNENRILQTNSQIRFLY